MCGVVCVRDSVRRRSICAVVMYRSSILPWIWFNSICVCNTADTLTEFFCASVLSSDGNFLLACTHIKAPHMGEMFCEYFVRVCVCVVVVRGNMDCVFTFRTTLDEARYEFRRDNRSFDEPPKYYSLHGRGASMHNVSRLSYVRECAPEMWRNKTCEMLNRWREEKNISNRHTRTAHFHFVAAFCVRWPPEKKCMCMTNMHGTWR